MKNLKLYTVGYEGLDIDEFVEGLRKKRVKTIADLRKNPLSRKPGFSKKRLAAALESVGIQYVHYSGLGVPSEWRRQARAGLISRDEMFRRYERQVLPEHQDELAAVEEGIQKSGYTILCYEADASDCHRRSVADEIQKRLGTKVEVVNLRIPKPNLSLRTHPVQPSKGSDPKKRVSLSSSKRKRS